MVYASNTFFSSCPSPNLDHLMPDFSCFKFGFSAGLSHCCGGRVGQGCFQNGNAAVRNEELVGLITLIQLLTNIDMECTWDSTLGIAINGSRFATMIPEN
jgi:hypothetical protein